MANKIEKVRITNPHGVEDVCSHITVDQNNSTLSITNWMTEAGTYTVQFWYKSTASRTLSVTCAGETAAVNSTTSWNKFTHTYVASTTSGLQIAMPVGEYWFYNMKAERGTAPSDWSPHPEDVSDDYNIDLIKMADTISVVESNVDANARAITNKLEITTFETEMQGVQNSLDRIGEGYDKWLVSVYNISDMNDLYDEDTDTTTAISGVYDITAFSDENADVNPANELLIQDEMASIYAPVNSLSGKMLYYLTYVNFTEATAVTTNFTHGKCTLYLNGAPVLKTDSTGTNQVILNFALGWNVIEIVSNQAGAKFAINISDHEKCYSMNCLMATPNARSVKIKRQFSNVNQYIDKIEMNVGTTITELREDLQGQIDQIETSQGTQYEQTTTKFSWLITDGSTSSNLTFTNAALTAMTNQFEVKDSDGNSVVISKGNVKANSITAKMLNTDAITSTNYQQTVVSGSSEPHYATQGTKLDLANGNFISPSLYINATSGNAWFKGDIHADNGYFNGEISSTKGTIGPWNIEDGYIWKGSKNFADGSAAGNIYLGNSGMSFGNKLVYDATKGTLNLNVNSLSIGNSDLSEYVTAYNGDNVFYTNTIPTASNYPASTWTTEADKIAHLDSICYDTSTGKLYKFTKTDRKIKITFSSSSATSDYQNDYLWIYYQKDGARYRTGYTSTRAMGTPGIAGASVVIPAESFWIWWHSNSDSTTDYGFKIDSVAVTSDAADAATASNLPNYTQRKLKPGELPETSHPYGANENFLWYVRPVLSGGTYVWQEVSVDGINLLSLSDLTSGGATISNESFVLSAQYGGSTDYFRIPSSAFNGNKSYCLSFKFKKNSTPTTGNTLNNMYIKFPSGLTPYYATLDGTDILSSINSTISVEDNSTEHTVQIKLNKTSSGNIDVYFNYNQATSVYMILSEIMLQEGTQFTEWSPSKKDLVSNIISSKASDNNYMWYDAANGLVIYNGRDANGNLYVLDGTTNTVSGLTTGNIRMTSSGLDLYKGQTLLTSYGETTTFYKYGSTTAAATLDANGLHIANGSITLGSNFSVNSSGNLVCSNASVSGVITATSGYIGSGTYKITLGDGTISYGMTSYTDTSHNGFWISSSGISLGGGAFKVTDAGYLTASSGTFSGSLSGATGDFTGTVTATSGYIGNGSNKITIGNGSISYGMTSYTDTSHDGFWISSDGIALGQGKVKLSQDGNILMNGANFGSEDEFTSGRVHSTGFFLFGDGRIDIDYSPTIYTSITGSNLYAYEGLYSYDLYPQYGLSFKYNNSTTVSIDTNGCITIPTGTLTDNYGYVYDYNGSSRQLLSSLYAAKNHEHSNYASSAHTHTTFSLMTEFRGGIKLAATEVTISNPGMICYGADGYTLAFKYLGSGSSIKFKDIKRVLNANDVSNFYSVKPVLAKYKDTYLDKNDPWSGIEMPMMIAEDIEAIYPNAILYDKEGRVQDYSDHLVVSVHQQMLIDQKQEIESLKREITALKQLLNK